MMIKDKTKRKRITAYILCFMMLAGIFMPMGLNTENVYAASEKAIANKEWDDVEKELKTKLGTSYEGIGLCTGFVYWALKNAYGVDWGDNSFVIDLYDKLVDKGITKVAEGTKGTITGDMKPGDIIIFFEGGSGSHCAILGEGGKLYHATTSGGVQYSPTLSEWMSYPPEDKNCDRYEVFRGLNSTGSLSIVKKSDNTDITNGNSCYSLKGAKYGLYKGNNLFGTLVTDEDGKASLDDIPYGSYTLKEIEPSKGYAIDYTAYKITIDDQTTKQTVTEIPQGDPVEILLQKAGGLSTISDPQGSASLEGAEFTVKYYKGIYTKAELAGETPARKWVFRTDENGQIGFAEKWLIADRSDEFYRSSKGIPTIPLGTISVQETKAPEGYKIDETLHVQQLKDNDSTLEGIEVVNEYVGDRAIIEPIIKGGVKINKQDNQTGSREQGDATFKGAAFSIINKSAGAVVVDGKEYANGQTVKTIYTGDDDIASTSADCLPYGDYTIKETAPPEGYKNTGVIERDFKIREDGKIVDLTSTPIKNDVIRGGVQIQKWDKELNKSEAIGGADYSKNKTGAKLTGIEFTIVNRSQNPVMVEDKLYDSGKTITTITTAWNEEKKAYTAQTPSDYLPYGTYTIQETKTNDSYLLTDGAVRYFEIREDGKVVTADRAGADLVFKNQVLRGDLEFVKVRDIYLDRLAGIPFKLTNKATGENHIIVTDKNGQAATGSKWNKHTHNTNGNDKLAQLESITAADADQTAGVWFGLGEFGSFAAPDDNLGALPYGTYVLDELRCEANKDLTLLTGIEISVYRNNTVIDMGTLTDDYDSVVIGTQAMDRELESRHSMARKDVTIVDTVEYDGVKPEKEYTLLGTIYDKETQKPLLIDGKEVTGKTTFTPKKTKGSVEVEFTFDASSLCGKEIVVFETLMQGEVLITEHRDIEDKKQTITFCDPKIGTKASDIESGTQEAMADDKAEIKDVIAYENLLKGQSYEAVGVLYDKETGKPILVKGKEVTEKTAFFANKADGETEMEFSFDATELAGKTVVVFEEIYWNGQLIAEHKDINAESQTIRFPAIGTKAADSETKNNVSHADSKVTIIDTVSYTNLTVGQEYTVTGKLVSKENGKLLEVDGKVVTNTVTFTPEESDGEVEVVFTFNGVELAGKTIVVFEELRRAGVDILTAIHADITDEEQSIYFPVIETTAYEKDTENKEVEPDKEVTVTDIVEYENLIPGKEYEIEGTIVDKETGEEIDMEPEKKKFTPEKPDGKVEMEFVIDTSKLEGKELVVFETLYLDGKIIADHTDLESKSQTIVVKEKDVDIVKTGDDMDMLFWVALMVTALAAGSVMLIMRRRKV